MNKYNFEPSNLIQKDKNSKYNFTPSKESKETNKKTDNTYKNVNKIMRFNKEG